MKKSAKTPKKMNGQKWDMLMGSDAIAQAVKCCKPDVIAAYPITPQTHIIEALSDMVARGEIKGQYIKVESEMTAIAACFGAVAAGSRSFTATSSHGLAFMHEYLHWFAGSRFPLVLVDANRALGGPWCIWTDQSDSMSQRDTGFIQVYCETVQECFDTVIQGYWVSEKLMIPVMVMLDGFILSHTMEPLYVAEQDLVDAFLPDYIPPYKLDIENPLSFGAATKGDSFYMLRKMLDKTMSMAVETFEDCNNRFYNIFGRRYDSVETYRLDEAEIVFVSSGAITGTVRVAVDRLRDAGLKIGLIRIRVFRPFPKCKIVDTLKSIKEVLVLNRAVSYGASSTLTQEIRAALYNTQVTPKVYDIVISLGGKEVYPETIMNLIEEKDKLQDNATNWI
jgi:pyruvate/2-oxoacid:ferredoxin oxidoreductase alpha subunit